MCRVLGVSRAGFYAWERRAPSDRDLADAWLTEKIREIHAESKGTYGARRVHADLRLAHDVRVGRKRVERLMALAGISGQPERRRRRTTVRLEGVRVAPGPCGARLQSGRPEPYVVGGHHLYPHVGGLVVSRARPRPLLPADRGVGDDRPPPLRARHRRAADGDHAAQTRPWGDPSLRPGVATRAQPALATPVLCSIGERVKDHSLYP